MEPAALVWAMQSAISSSMATDLPLGLALDQMNNVLYSVGSQANQYLISKFSSLSSNPPSLDWTQKFTLTQSAFTSCFLTLIQEANPNSLIVSGPSSMNFVILTISSGAVAGSTRVFDPTQTSLTTLDVLATSPTSLSALVYGTAANTYN